MRGLLKRNRGELITALIILVLEAIFFFAVLFSPNSYFFNDGSRDSIQNYFVDSYASRYDYGFHFSGMNYPFGDQILFANAQFPFTALIHFIDYFLFNGIEHSVGILNLLTLLSFVLCGVFIYKILREFAVGDYFSIVSAVLITILSPQLQCITYHYNLAYLHVLPATLFFIIRLLNSTRRFKWMLILFFHTLLFSLIYFYYLAIIMSFALPGTVFYVVLTKKKEKWQPLKRQLMVISSLLTVGIIILIFLHFTDSVHDRVKQPWGFYSLHTTIGSVFYPPLWNGFNFTHIDTGNTEVYSYIGFACIVLLFLSLLIFLKRLFKLQFLKAFLFSSSPALASFLATGIIIMVFSIRFPSFLYNFLYHHLSIACQFRVLGRFAWIFYYVAGIYCARFSYLIYRSVRIKKKNAIAISIIAPLMIIWTIEGYYNIEKVARQIRQADMNFNHFKNNGDKALLQQAHLLTTDFQAILALPFTHIGSELLNRDYPDVLAMACDFSYNYHLPMMDSYMGRTSVSQTATLLQIESSPLIRKTVVNYFPNNKPILLIINKHDTLSAAEHYLIQSAHCFYENSDFSLSVLPVSAFSDSISEIRNRFLNHSQTLFNYDNYFTNIHTNSVIFKELSKDINAPFLSEEDSGFDDAIHVCNSTLKADSIGQKFELSLWQKLNTSSFSLPAIIFDQYNHSGKLLDEKLYYADVSSLDFYKGWIRAALHFTNYTLDDSISVKIWGARQITASNLLIRPVNVDVYTNLNLKDSSFTINNYGIEDK